MKLEHELVVTYSLISINFTFTTLQPRVILVLIQEMENNFLMKRTCLKHLSTKVEA